MRTYQDNWALVGQLWPNFKATPAQLAEWVSRLGAQRRQDWVEQAIRDHFSLDGPKDGGDFAPRLSRVLRRLSEIAESGEAAATNDRPCRWRACWRDFGGCHRSSQATFLTEEGALAFAARMGSDPCTLRVGGDRGSFDWDEHARLCEADAQQVLADMLTWDANRRKAALAYMAMLGFSEPVPDPDDVRKWSRTARGLAHAADERLRTPAGKAQYAKLAGSTPAWTREKP